MAMRIRGNKLLRLADATAGRALVAALGVLPRRRVPAIPRRIGVLKTAAIGDTILISAILQDLRERYPDAALTLLTGSDNAEAGALVAGPGLRHVVVHVGNPPGAVRALRRGRFDILIDCGSWPRLDAIVTALSGARFRVGFATAGQQRHYAFDRAVEHSASAHEVENYRALLRSFGVPASAPPRIPTENIAAHPVAVRAPCVVLHPWAAGANYQQREWPVSRWCELARNLADSGMNVAVTAHALDRDRAVALVGALAGAGVQAEPLHDLSLARLSATLLHAAALVSVNTGVMHLGAALGVPTVGLHGPTSAARWGPVGPVTRAVSSRNPGCGYLNLGFEYDGRPRNCMDGVLVDDVVRAVHEVLNLKRSPAGAGGRSR